MPAVSDSSPDEGSKQKPEREPKHRSSTYLQVPARQRRQFMEDIQAEMASVMAAAVHHGWIPIEEMLDLLDGNAVQTQYIQPKLPVKCSFGGEEREWALWTVQHYLEPQLARKFEHVLARWALADAAAAHAMHSTINGRPCTINAGTAQCIHSS